MNKYLLEIGVEEFPAGDVRSMLDQLDRYFKEMVQDNGLSYSELKIESTPRRFAILINELNHEKGQEEEEVRGPSLAIAYDGEEPTKALQGFLKGQGANLDEIIIKDHNGEDYVFVKKLSISKPINEILAKEIPGIIRKLNSSRTMRWGGKDLRFARPIRYFVSLYNDEILEFDLEGIKVGNRTKGHRELGSDNILIDKIDNYRSLLKDNGVILRREDRKQIIKSESIRLAKSNGGELLYSEELLDELTDINEFPTPVMGSFDERYLSLPKDVIVTVMVDHQRYFAVGDGEGNLIPNFITIRNGGDKGLDNVRKGNEKVIEPRLKDGEFFYDQDLNHDLEDFVPKLKTASYHEDLGSIYDKTMRLIKLSELIGNQLAVANEAIENTKRAAYLSKADLMTNMVTEFTELQGIMGKIYALKSGEKKSVAIAIEEQYMPKHAGADLPESTAGMVLSIADKLDTICSMYAVGIRVTGSQDPYALRRAALGIIRIIVDKKLDLDIEDLVKDALYTVLEDQSLVFDYDEVMADILDFFKIRFRTMLIDEGYEYDLIDSVLKTGDKNIYHLYEKVVALTEFLSRDNELLESLVRIENMTKDYQAGQISEDLMTEDEEIALYKSIARLDHIDDLINKDDYIEALEEYKLLSPLLNDFFDNVMVMVDDEEIRKNRLSLLSRYRQSIQSIFIASEIVKD